MGKRLNAIKQDVEGRTGIDFGKYNRPDLVASFAAAVTAVASPLSVIFAVIRSLVMEFLIVNACLGAICYVTEPELWKMVLFLAVGNIGFPIAAIAYGLVGNIRRLALTTGGAMVETLDLAGDALDDMEQMGRRDVAAVDVVKGVLFVGVVPAVAESLENKAGFLAMPVVAAFDRLSHHMARALPKLMKESDTNEPPADNKAPFDKTRYTRQIAALGPKIVPYIEKKIVGRITLPLRFVSTVSTALTLALLLGIYVFLIGGD